MAMPSVSRLEKQGPHHSVIQGDVAAMRGVSSLRVALRGEGFSAAGHRQTAAASASQTWPRAPTRCRPAG